MELHPDIKKQIENLTTTDMFEDGALNLQKVANKVGISEILKADFENDAVSGLLKNENGAWRIYVNASDSPQRRRFTIAHEIGHLISYKVGSRSKGAFDSQGEISDQAYLQRTGEVNPVEAEANAIAAKLLMPTKDVIALKEEGKTVEEMAERFQVSESAMSVRLQTLGYKLFEFEMENHGSASSQGGAG